MLKEYEIIEKLIDEDEKQSLDYGITLNEDLGAWRNISRNKIGIKKISKSNQSPDYEIQNIPKPKKLLGKLPHIRQITHNSIIYPANLVHNSSKKAKLSQKLITINDTNEPPLLNPPEKLTYKTPSPIKFKGLKILSKSKRCNFSLDTEKRDPISFLYVPNDKPIKYKKIEGVGYFSPIYEKYFKKSGSNNRILEKSEYAKKDSVKFFSSKKDIGGYYKNRSGSNIKTKIPIEGSKILKKFLLNPIYQNICKYNSVLNN